MLMATLSLADWQNLFPIQTGPEVEDLSRQIRTANDQLQELSGRIQRGEHRLAEELTKELPNEICQMTKLKKLYLDHNLLTKLPHDLHKLGHSLTLLGI